MIKTGLRDTPKLAAIKLEWWPGSDWNRWPPSSESARDCGVRIFSDGRDPKTQTSLTAERRMARGMRRRRDRYLQRRTALLNALVRHGLMPLDITSRNAIAAMEPYQKRGDALVRKLENFELGRVIFHLNQRRGFKS